MNDLSKKTSWAIGLVLILVSVDQIIKYIIRQMGGFYICNVGISFGISLSKNLIWVIYSIVGSALFYLLFQKKLRYNSISLSLIIGGGLSNLLDRIFHGCVVDYIDIRIWPVFNLADVVICIGTLLLLIEFLNNNKK
jgi:signal peptidase II